MLYVFANLIRFFDYMAISPNIQKDKCVGPIFTRTRFVDLSELC